MITLAVVEQLAFGRNIIEHYLYTATYDGSKQVEISRRETTYNSPEEMLIISNMRNHVLLDYDLFKGIVYGFKGVEVYKGLVDKFCKRNLPEEVNIKLSKQEITDTIFEEIKVMSSDEFLYSSVSNYDVPQIFRTEDEVKSILRSYQWSKLLA